MLHFIVCWKFSKFFKNSSVGTAGDQKAPGASGDQPAVPGVVERKKVQTAPRPTEFINCQSKLMGGESLAHSFYGLKWIVNHNGQNSGLKMAATVFSCDNVL